MDNSIEQLRQRIDRIDQEIVTNLAERMNCSAEIVRYKTTVRDEARELEVLERVRKLASGKLCRSHADSVFRRIIRASVATQMDIISQSSREVQNPTDDEPFQNQRIAVVGVGRMGSWMAGAVAEHCPVAVFDIEQERAAAVHGVLHLEKLEQIRDFNPTTVVNAVGIMDTVQVFSDLVPYLSSDCILVDLMSVKGSIQNFHLGSGRPFVSIHPMFGPGHADMSDLCLENAVIITESSDEASREWETFLSNLGIMIHHLSFSEHDQVMSLSLTLPFAASIVFAASLGPGAVPGTTFSRHLLLARRLFMEDDYLLAEVLFNPRSREMLNRVCSSLEYLKHIIDAAEYATAVDYFAELRKKVRDVRP